MRRGFIWGTSFHWQSRFNLSVTLKIARQV
nr:MAG TPA: hypothetical protein [Siphoviridae sp. ctX8T1]